jgi:hypothetical protein
MPNGRSGGSVVDKAELQSWSNCSKNCRFYYDTKVNDPSSTHASPDMLELARLVGEQDHPSNIVDLSNETEAICLRLLQTGQCLAISADGRNDGHASTRTAMGGLLRRGAGLRSLTVGVAASLCARAIEYVVDVEEQCCSASFGHYDFPYPTFCCRVRQSWTGHLASVPPVYQSFVSLQTHVGAACIRVMPALLSSCAIMWWLSELKRQHLAGTHAETIQYSRTRACASGVDIRRPGLI